MPPADRATPREAAYRGDSQDHTRCPECGEFIAHQCGASPATGAPISAERMTPAKVLGLRAFRMLSMRRTTKTDELARKAVDDLCNEVDRCHAETATLTAQVAALTAERDTVRTALWALLDAVDYDAGSCDIGAMLGSVLSEETLRVARAALAHPAPDREA